MAINLRRSLCSRSVSLLPTDRVVQKEAWERRAPIFEHADRCAARKVLRDSVFRHPGNPAPSRAAWITRPVFAEGDSISFPGKVFDLVLPLEQVAEGYRAMDERLAIKTR